MGQPEATPNPVVRKLRSRAESWRNVFIVVLVLGLIGSYLIARAAGTTTDIFGDTTHDSNIQIVTFVVSAASSLLFSLPFLAFSQILEASADLYES